MNKERMFRYNNLEVRKIVQDRGNIKWSTLMLPEHAELLKELWAEDKKAVKPILDPQEIENMNHQLEEAYVHQHAVTLSIYEKGIEMDYAGKIKNMDKERKCIILKRKYNGEIKINFDSVIGFTIN
ncbi:YolD-like family protein [Virgibacillus oceani]